MGFFLFAEPSTYRHGSLTGRISPVPPSTFLHGKRPIFLDSQGRSLQQHRGPLLGRWRRKSEYSFNAEGGCAGEVYDLPRDMRSLTNEFP